MRVIKSILVILLAMAGFTAYGLFMPANMPKEGVIFYVPPGSSRLSVVSDLSNNHLLRVTWLFDVYTSFFKRAPKAGEYTLKEGSSAYQIWQQLLAGTGRYYRSFTIIPGSTFKQIRANLNKETTIKHATPDLPDSVIMAVMGDTKHGPEGMFMPETYNYMRGDADLSLLKRAYDLMQLKLKDDWATRAPNLPYQDAYQALIAASLIEKEAYLPAEQPIIAGVLINRINKNMLLQFDPTVIYGLGDKYKGKIYKSDLVKNTPYNTYLHKGLPPTPIAMPGLGALHAALHPATHDYLYFVATNKGDGSHEFTKSLVEHYGAVKKAADAKVKSTAAPTGATNAAS